MRHERQSPEHPYYWDRITGTAGVSPALGYAFTQETDKPYYWDRGRLARIRLRLHSKKTDKPFTLVFNESGRDARGPSNELLPLQERQPRRSRV
jgi:hypothetical protein